MWQLVKTATAAALAAQIQYIKYGNTARPPPCVAA